LVFGCSWESAVDTSQQTTMQTAFSFFTILKIRDNKSTHTPYSVNMKYVRGMAYDGTLDNEKTIQIPNKKH